MIDKRALKGRIIAAGHTQASLAAEIHISRNNLNLKLNGHLSFTTDEVMRICDVLGIHDPHEKVHIFLRHASH